MGPPSLRQDEGRERGGGEENMSDCNHVNIRSCQYTMVHAVDMVLLYKMGVFI